MTTAYRVVDLRSSQGEVEHHIESNRAPERVASEVLGLDLVRSGSPKELIAKVYWQKVAGEPFNVVRLYGRIAGGKPRRPKKEYF